MRLISLLCPEDIILLKAIMQRGQDKGKHDTADILALIRHHRVDWDYITRRAGELRAKERILPYLRKNL